MTSSAVANSGGLEVDDELELGRLNTGRSAGLGDAQK
jgi:hypothetical protein